jgi:hypothetical protein
MVWIPPLRHRFPLFGVRRPRPPRAASRPAATERSPAPAKAVGRRACQDRALQRCALRARLRSRLPSRIAGIRLSDKGPPGQSFPRRSAAVPTAALNGKERVDRQCGPPAGHAPRSMAPFGTFPRRGRRNGADDRVEPFTPRSATALPAHRGMPAVVVMVGRLPGAKRRTNVGR